MKTQFSRMSDEEMVMAVKGSITSRKYHGPEVKCGGPGQCADCSDRVKNGTSFEFDDVTETPAEPMEESNKCSCSPRGLFWKGCTCGYVASKK